MRCCGGSSSAPDSGSQPAATAGPQSGCPCGAVSSRPEERIEFVEFGVGDAPYRRAGQLAACASRLMIAPSGLVWWYRGRAEVMQSGIGLCFYPGPAPWRQGGTCRCPAARLKPGNHRRLHSLSLRPPRHRRTIVSSSSSRPDQWRQLMPLDRFKPAFDRARGEYLPSLDRRGIALHCDMVPPSRRSNSGADQLLCAVGDDVPPG